MRTPGRRATTARIAAAAVACATIAVGTAWVARRPHDGELVESVRVEVRAEVDPGGATAGSLRSPLDRGMTISIAGALPPSAALLLFDERGAALAPPLPLEEASGASGGAWGAAPRKRTRVQLRALRPHVGALHGALVLGGAREVTALLVAAEATLAGSAPLADKMTYLEAEARGRHVRIQRVALDSDVAAVAPTLDSGRLADAARTLSAGDPARALAMIEASRGAATGRLGAEADALASEAAFAFGRVALAKRIAARGLAAMPPGEPLLEARLLRSLVVATAESDEAGEPGAPRERLRAAAALRRAPVESALDAAADVRVALARDRITPERPTLPAAARALSDALAALAVAEVAAAAAMACTAGAELARGGDTARGAATLALGTRAAEAAGAIGDQAFCAFTAGDLARTTASPREAERHYARALALLGDRPLPREQREAWTSSAQLAMLRGDPTRAFEDASRAIAWVETLLDLETDFDARNALLMDTVGYYGDAVKYGLAAGLAERAMATAERGKGRAFGALLEGHEELTETRLGTLLAGRARLDAGHAQDLAALRGSLGPDDAALSYMLVGATDEGRLQLAIGVATRDRVTGVVVAEPDDALPSIAELARAVARNDLARARELGGVVYEALVAPVAAALQGKTRIFVSPHLPIHGVPWPALHDGARFLAERIAFARVPPMVFSARAESDDAITLAAPERRWLFAVDADHPGAPKLPGLRPLTLDLEAKLHPRATLTGGAATPDAIVRALGSSDALFYAGHARYDREHPLKSALLVSADATSGADRLEASRLVGMGARLAVVLLVGCETARLWDRTMSYSDEAIGLPRAFLAGGARHVIGALWPILDRDAEDFARALVAEAGPRDVVRAVGAAQACMAAGRCASRGIAAWASFAVDTR